MKKIIRNKIIMNKIIMNKIIMNKIIMIIFILMFRFVSLNFPHTPSVLLDNMSTRAGAETPRGFLDNLPEVTEVRLVGLGHRGRRPVLLTRTRDNEVVMYEVE